MKQRALTGLMIVSLTLATGTMALANGKNDSKPQTTNTAQNVQTGDQAYIVKEFATN